MTALRLAEVVLHPICIRLRGRFRHAAGERSQTDNVLVELRDAQGRCGFGECVPRPYVSGETQASVLADIPMFFLPHLQHAGEWRAFRGVVEWARDLPYVTPEGRTITAARAGIELALLDLASRALAVPVADGLACGLELPRPTLPAASVRVSGVLGISSPLVTYARLLGLRALGLRAFKIKLNEHIDLFFLNQLSRWARQLGVSLRADANSAWAADRAREQVTHLAELGFSSVEEPIRQRYGPGRWGEVLTNAPLPIIVDESCVTPNDLAAWCNVGPPHGVNLRLCKNGGLAATLALTRQAQESALFVQLGCMVGQTSLTSAAEAVAIHLLTNIRHVESHYGHWLVRDDVVARPRTFRLGGRVPLVRGLGWGCEVDRSRLDSMRTAEPISYRLSG